MGILTALFRATIYPVGHTMQLNIQPMTTADRAEALDVARSLAAWFQPLDQMALAMDLRQHQGLVARQPAGELVGFLTYHLLDGDRAELSWFGIAPEAQGVGIGSQLLVALETQLRAAGVKRLQLSTVPADHDPTFAATNAFYERHGFQRRQRDDHYYAHNRPRLLFEKDLL